MLSDKAAKSLHARGHLGVVQHTVRAELLVCFAYCHLIGQH